MDEGSFFSQPESVTSPSMSLALRVKKFGSGTADDDADDGLVEEQTK